LNDIPWPRHENVEDRCGKGLVTQEEVIRIRSDYVVYGDADDCENLKIPIGLK